MKRENLIVALSLLSLATVAPALAESPKARSLREDFRKVPGLVDADRIDRSVAIGSPRGQANETVVIPGVSADRIHRGLAVTSPRAATVFPFLKESGNRSSRADSVASASRP